MAALLSTPVLFRRCLPTTLLMRSTRRTSSTNLIIQSGAIAIAGGAFCSRSDFHEEQQRAGRRLILYGKPGCCLCDGLKEKLRESGGLADVQLEVRDITTNEKWWNSYQYEIPVLARLGDDGTEEPLPRLSPRLTAEQVQKKIRALMTSVS